MVEPEYKERYRMALERLTREIDNLRTVQAAIAAYNEAQPPSNRFLTLAFIALLGDRLLRLIRIFEDNRDTASFWYLHRCTPERMKHLDVERLKSLSGKLKTVRDLTFVHLDKRGISKAAAIWREAGITEAEIIEAIETVRHTLYDIWCKEFGRPLVSISDNMDPRWYPPSLEGLKELLKKSLVELSRTEQQR